jgi:hypothetical protein
MRYPTTRNFVVRNTVKAAHYEFNRLNRVIVKFDKPAGSLKTEFKILKPFFKKDFVYVRCYRGIWELSSFVSHYPDMLNKSGKHYRGCITFEAHHIAWTDEWPHKTVQELLKERK